MGGETPDEPPIRCLKCGFEAELEDSAWDEADHPALGTVKQCPECGSRNTTGLSRG